MNTVGPFDTDRHLACPLQPAIDSAPLKHLSLAKRGPLSLSGRKFLPFLLPAAAAAAVQLRASSINPPLKVLAVVVLSAAAAFFREDATDFPIGPLLNNAFTWPCSKRETGRKNQRTLLCGISKMSSESEVSRL